MSLYQEFRQVIAEFWLLPHGAIASYNPSGVPGVPDSCPPSGESAPPQEKYIERWADLERLENRESAAWPLAISSRDPERRELIAEAKAELAAIRKGKQVEVKGETETELSERILLAGVGFSVKDVALALRVTETRVRKARAGRVNMDDGSALEGISLEVVDQADRKDKAAELKARGMTLRQIAMLLGVDAATVSRDLA